MAKKTNAEEQQDKLINLQAQQLAAQIANWAAQLEFQKERMRLLELPEMQGKMQIEIDRLAWDKAQGEWEKAFKEAAITGKYQGQDTVEWLTQQAQLTGVLNGQQTIQGKLTDAQITQMNEQMRLANAQFVTSTTGYLNGQKTFDREKWEAAQATDAWKFLATLTGPSNAFKQARAIGTMPGGMSDLMSAWAGEFATPGTTSVGSGGRASLEGLMGAGADSGLYGAPGTGATVGYAPTGTGDGAYAYPGGGPSPMAAPTYVPPPMQYHPGTPGHPEYLTPPGVDMGSQGSGPAAPAAAPVMAPGAASGEQPPPGVDLQAWLRARQGGQSGYWTQDAGGQWVFIPGASDGSVHIPGGPFQPPDPAQATEGELPPEGVDVQSWLRARQGDQQGSWAVVNGRWVFAPGPSGPLMGPISGGEVGESAGIPDMGSDAGSGMIRWGGSSPYTYDPAGTRAPTHQWNYSMTPSGGTQVYPPGTTSPWDTPDISSSYPMSPQSANNIYRFGVAATNPYTRPGVARPTVSYYQAPHPSTQKPHLLPNQIDARNYANSYQYQRELGWADFEDQGWDKSLAQEAFQRSLPKYGGPKSGSFAF